MCGDMCQSLKKLTKVSNQNDATLLIFEGVIAKSLELHSAKGLNGYHRHA
jgi:hypothetical protein